MTNIGHKTWIPVSERLPTTKIGEQVKILFCSPGWISPFMGIFTYWGKEYDDVPEYDWAIYNPAEDRYYDYGYDYGKGNLPTLWQFLPTVPEV